MFEISLIYLSTGLKLAGYALFLLLWWFNRRERLLSSVPWIFGYFLFSSLHILPAAVSTRFRQVMDFAGLHNMYGLVADCAVALHSAADLGTFLLTLMVTFNAAFLLEQVAPGGRFQRRLADAHRCQSVLGILLLLAAIFPAVLTVGVVLLWR